MTNRLEQWLTDNGVSDADFAQRVEAAGPWVVWRWKRGKSRPNDVFMSRVYVATNGAVTPNDFYDLPDLLAGRAANCAGVRHDAAA